MNLSGISVKRYVAMSAFILMLIFLGINVYKNIGLDVLPKTDIPYVQITTAYPGASPQEIEVDVARRIEDTVASLDGLKHTTSICMENVCSTTLEFEYGVDAAQMIHEVREKLNLIADDFPSGVETPKLSQINMNAIPVVTLFLTGNKPIDELYDYVDDVLSDKFSGIRGVGEVRIHGGNEMQLHVILDRKKLIESGLSVASIVERINSANIKLPAGHIKENGTETNITYDAEFHDIASLKALEISTVQGKRIYLGDIAEIKLMSKELRQDAYYNGERGIQIEIVKKSDANAVKVIEEVRKRYDEIMKSGQLPSGMRLHWFKDSGEFVNASVEDAWVSVIAGILLTALVLFLFLHNFRSTFIVALTVPVAFVISFVAMNFLGYTFDLITLIALGCAVGVLVDNAIVVLENINKHLEDGSNAENSAIHGAGEIMTAVAASSLTNIVVFVPIALMSSMVSMIISPFAGVTVATTAVSLFISFTLTPILASKFFARKAQEPPKLLRCFYNSWDKNYERMSDKYVTSIRWTKKHPFTVIGITILISICAMIYAVPRTTMGFFPINDKSEISLTLEYPVNVSLDVNRERSLKIMEKIAQRNDVLCVTSTMGYINAVTGQVSEGVYLTEITLMLKPKDQRKNIFAIADELRAMLKNEPDLRYSVNIPLPTGGSQTEVMAYISGTDYDVLNREGKRAMQILEKSGLARDIDSTIRVNKPRINIIPDKTVLKNLNIPESALGISVMGFFDGVEAGTYKVGTRTFDIRVKTNELSSAAEAGNLSVGTLNGKIINIDTLAALQNDPVMVSMIRQDKARSVWIYCNPAPGHVLGECVELLKKEVGAKLPPGYTLHFSGPAEMMEDGAADFVNVFIVAIVLTYLLIAALMESWWNPFLILFTIPLGFVGMVFTLSLFGEAVSMVGLLGCLMMIGIVVNNAILLMDEVKSLVAGGTDKREAMVLACRNKLRPILMTSLTSIIGMLPMAFGTGIGSELRRSCGLGVVGGLFFSSFITIYLIPALYFIFTKQEQSKQ